jgi:hypothetical protein
MTRLAGWIMGSPLGAALVTLLFGFSGVFSWAAPVPVVLITLRSGLAKAWMPLLVLCGVVAMYVEQGEITLVGIVITSLGAAVVLGGRSSLPMALMIMTGIAIAFTMGVAGFASGQLDSMLAQYRQAMELLVQPEGAALPDMTSALLLQLIGIWVCITSVANLFVARSMQARLYNPGGFREEFHGLRLTPVYTALCLLPVLAAEFWPGAEAVAGTGLIPVMLAGLGLLHGVVARKRWGAGPLVVTYLGLFLMAPVVTPLLLMAAMADSFFDFRQKLA